MKTAKIMAQDYDDLKFMEYLNDFINSDEVKEVQELIIGNWGEMGYIPCEDILSKLVENANKFEKLERLFFADIESEENEISWIELCDMSPLFEAFPKLKSFKLKGSSELEFRDLKHENLEEFILITGGLPDEVNDEIKNAKFPNLKHLELYIGCADYGAEPTPADLQGFISGKIFPKLKYLGLKNSDIENEIAESLLETEILPSIEILDLSMGTMTDEGAEFLLQNEKLKTLKAVDVSDNYISDEKLKEMEESEINFILGKQKEAYESSSDYTYYYTTIGE